MTTTATSLRETLHEALLSPLLFAHGGSGLKLRAYQEQAALAIVESALHHLGLSFVVIFPRQSGKNELQAQIEAYLLTVLSLSEVEIVKVSPTWKPQSLNAMRRLERTLKRNLIARSRWVKEQGFIYRVGSARISFLSGAPGANVVGATANLLLECDEAQDVSPEKWDKEIAPMAASTNATRVFWGTAWSAQTLLGRERRQALEAQRRDGVRRLFEIDAGLVGAEVPAYRKFVDWEIQRLGRNHPFVRTQFFSEEIDEQAGMFPPERLALMQGTHPPAHTPRQDQRCSEQQLWSEQQQYAFLIDVAGSDETSMRSAASGDGGGSPRRDSTALTIVAIDPGALSDPLLQAPVYRVQSRRLWTNLPHTRLYAELTALAELWQPQAVVIDATGIGAGLASFLKRALGAGRVQPFVFTQASKSKLAWDFLSMVETGRYKEFTPSVGADLRVRPDGLPDNPDGPPDRPDEQSHLQALFFEQCRAAQLEVLPGPGRLARWGVPDGRHSSLSGVLLHDDLLVSAALCAALDELPWGEARSAILPPRDPLEGMSWMEHG